ncbi:MAG: hypothetical protein A2086_06260 [Spirochaetes bacterium GWD1_27_9]|nr:MAG: hypothetical protein A2Z98_16915 [Spirochaetes bacterium GWB1_27_13]OHD30868.1 MAG: hypothetical protein A2086_06260 [Spirochaetes bacterium GWD1_27_9]
MNFLTIFFIIQIILVVVFNIIKGKFFKNAFFKRLILLFSVFYGFILFGKIIEQFLPSVSFLINLLVFLCFIGLSLYILIAYGRDFDKIIEAFDNLAKGEPNTVLKLNLKQEFKILGRLYLQLNMNFNSLLANVEKFSVELFDKMEKIHEKSLRVKDAINMQKGISTNLDNVLNMQNDSINTGARGLDDTRMMFKKMTESFTVLFNLISSVFDQNLAIQNENKNMENYSLSAIDFTQDLKKITLEGTEKIDNIIKFIGILDKSVKSIKEMIIMIKKITSQTNLLAMNASIEAAHAGEYGRGFAVVADEIRGLAESSSNATQSITKIVDSIFEEMENGKNYSKIAKEGINEINQAIEKTITIIGSVSHSINQQIKSAVDMKEIIEQIHEHSKEIKDSSEYQQKKTQEIYETTENLNSQGIIISALLMQQKSQITELLNMITDLGKIVYDSNTYSSYLNEMVEKFKNQHNTQ